MKRHYYQIMYQLKMPHGHAQGDTQISTNIKIRPKDINDIRAHIKEINKSLSVESVVITGVYYIGYFKVEPKNGEL